MPWKRFDSFFHSRAPALPKAPSGAGKPNGTILLAPSTSRDLRLEAQTIIASKIFDEDWYRHRSKQVKGNRKKLVLHYLRNAEQDRIDPHPLFSRAYYASRCGAHLDGLDPLAHYLLYGWRQHADPHPLFDVKFYLEENDDVRAAGREPLGHYIEYGWREGRSPCEEFDISYYLRNNADVRTQGCEPLRHFLEHGAPEGRDPSHTFETLWYVRNVLRGAPDNPLAHFRAQKSACGRSAGRLFLSSQYEMSARDFERWTKTFPSPAKTDATAVDMVHVTDVTQLIEAAAALRARDEDDRLPVYLVCRRDDEIDPHLLPHLKRRMADAELGIFDLAVRKDGLWVPVLLPGANPVHLEAVDATFSRFAISGDLLRKLEIASDATAYDILRSALARLREAGRLDRFVHLAMPILRVPNLLEQLHRDRIAMARASHLGPRPDPRRAKHSVSVVICTKDRCRLLTQLLDSLLRQRVGLVNEIVVVANPAENSYAAQVHAYYAGRQRIEILRHDGPYNFSLQSNRGASRCTGELILFLNDDIVPIASHWLDALAASFDRPEVGVVGPLLLYPDERVQHAGMYLGPHSTAGHAIRGTRLPEDDYMFLGTAPRNVSAVTGAALLTRRALFEDMNGFDRQLGTYLQDVDFCLRAIACGHEVVFDPRAALFHMESVSMRDCATTPVFADRRPLEHERFVRKWGSVVRDDAFFNPNFDIHHEHLRVLAPPRLHNGE